jgi:hypothetical protein
MGDGVPGGFESFRARVMQDPALQRALDCTIYPDVFAAKIEAAAGGSPPPEWLRPRSRPVPGECDLSPGWGPEGWLPARLCNSTEGAIVDWAHFGQAPLDASFYHDAVARTVARPFNRLFRHATRLDDLIADARPGEAAPLAGFVFHMSRCGSTLVSRMFGAIPETISLSEPGPLDAVVRLAIRADASREWAIAALRAMVAALARRRNGERRCVIKLDSWHILALPLFRQAFPEVPWIYLFREPVEVLVSHMRMRGYQTVPALMPPGLYKLDDLTAAAPELLCARILAQFHEAALPALQARQGIAIDYAALPGAVGERIVPHFGLDLTETERAAMASVSRRDAKAQDSSFTPDAESKRQAASEAVRNAAEERLARLHRELTLLA